MTSKARRDIDVPWDELRAARVQRKVLDAFRAQREQRVSPTEVNGLPRPRRWLLLFSVASGIIVLFAAAATWRTVSGSPDTVASETSVLDFADGSRSHLSQRAQLQVLDNRRDQVLVRQTAGEVRYEITPHRVGSFQVQAGNLTVTVIGTVFDVALVKRQIIVSVQRGHVRVEQGKRKISLGPGERVTVDWDSPEAARDEALPPAASHSATVKAPVPTATPSASVPPAETAAELLSRADAARAAGRLAEAAMLLRTLIAEHSRDERVTLALFTLGRVEQQQGDHAAAARAFERCGMALQGDALAEAAAAWSAANQHQRAQAAASRYLERYPDGVHTHRMRSIVGR